MIWFEGTIAHAVQTSKTRNAIFVVYVEGKDDNSVQMTEMLNHPEVSQKLATKNFVAIKLESGSESYNQFVQIYQLVPVPSLFFIGKNGAPIEVIPQRLDPTEFLSKIDSILTNGGYTETSTSTVKAKTDQFLKSESSPEKSQTPLVSTGAIPKQVLVDKVQSESSETSVSTLVPQEPTTSTSNEASTSIEEKVERAKQLIEQKREAKRIAEEEAQRDKEMERRKMGQEVQKMRRQHQEDELKQLREERLREKNEEIAARQKILAQIAQDKEERAKKFAPKPTDSHVPTAPPVAAVNKPLPARDLNMARLQFRLADGSSHTHDFDSQNTLQNIREYVQTHMNLPYRHFDLSTTFPRRQFGEVDNSRTLTDLELVPNAVILVVPQSPSAVTPASANTGGFLGFFWILMAPIIGILGYVKGVWRNWRAPPARPVATKRASEDPPHSSSIGPSNSKRRMGESTVVRRQGNIHRLTDRNDSDEENNTWNGNSTQQM